ncbi:MAG: BamA/TamA family outer membrane protein, partial [bacterium]|nr:BamA/TamA family outer membrane protein [bacterium]
VNSVEVGEPFTQANLEQAVGRELGRAQERGFFFARLRVTQVAREGLRVTVNARMNLGPRVEVSSLTFTGLKQSRPEVLKRYIELKAGDSLTTVGLAATEEDALAIPFVRFRPPARILPRPGYAEADVELGFDELRQFHIFGGVGYVPDDDKKIVWNLDLKLRNLFGGGKQVAVKSDRRNEGRNSLHIAYGQPFFLMGTGWLDLEVATRDYRDDFYEFGLQGRFTARLARKGSTGLGLAWRRVEPAGDSPSFSAYTVEYSIGRMFFDEPLNPSKGFQVSAAIAYTYRRYTSIDSVTAREVFNETRSRLSLQAVQPMYRGLVGYLGAQYMGLETGEELPPLSELALIGGPGSLRGFRNEQFAAQRAGLATLEPRLRFSQGYAFLFYDAAYINRRLSNGEGKAHTEELYRDGFGLGLSLFDKVRSIKLSLGWNRDAGFDQPQLSIEMAADL